MTIYLDSFDSAGSVGNAVSDLLSCTKTALIASPYISGDIAQRIMSGVGSVKLLCNARSPATNPYLLKELLDSGNIEIRSFEKLHAKVYCFDNGVVITSANATPNGLGEGLLEAACRIDNSRDLKKIREWFDSLWESSLTENISDYPQSTWKELESRWNLAKPRKTSQKQKLSDLIRARRLPDDLVFIFYNETSNAPSQSSVAKSAAEQEVKGLPPTIDDWDYFIESEDYRNTSALLDPILRRYYGYKCVNYAVKGWPFTKVYKKNGFFSVLLDRSIRHTYKGKDLCLVLYRKVPVMHRTSVDSEVATMLNESLARNSKAWNAYLESTEGKYGYCCTKQLYKLLGYT